MRRCRMGTPSRLLFGSLWWFVVLVGSGGGGGGALGFVPRAVGCGRVGESSTASTALRPRVTLYASRSGRKMPMETKGNLDHILEQNADFVKQKLREDPNYFADMANTQHPKFLWIGCSDARVPANVIMGELYDTVFVHRNIANMVVNTDVNFLSVLQYAVDFLKVQHIIVCGHYDCGGVRAAMENTNHGSPLENWLRNIRDVYRIHKVELNAIEDVTQRQRRLVELNVIEQCLNVFKSHVVQRRRLATSEDPDSEFIQPRVHAMVYEPGTGKLNKLPVKFRSYIDELGDIYDLYGDRKDAIGAVPID